LLLHKGKHAEFILLTRLKGLYRLAIDWAVRHKKRVVIIALAAFVATMLLVPLIGTEFVPTMEEGSIFIGVTMAPSIALVVDDPDAPAPEPHVHWVVYGLDPQRDGIPEDSAGGAVEGLTTGGKVGYNGPAPPADGGPHRYRFRLYALDKSPGLKPGATRKQLMERIEGSVLGETEVKGTYERQLGDTGE
jgi:Raf kinase inhibitor-like YbhB/YbcL family protein